VNPNVALNPVNASLLGLEADRRIRVAVACAQQLRSLGSTRRSVRKILGSLNLECRPNFLIANGAALTSTR
jgi:hypothetical protein